MRIISDIFAHRGAHAEVQLDLDLRLPHAGGGRDADLELAYTLADGVEYVRAGALGRAPDRPLRAAPLVLLGDRHELLHGGGQAAGRAPHLGQADEEFEPKDRALALAAHALPDLGLVARRTGRVQQRGAHRRSRRWRRRRGTPVAAHQRARRGAGPADRLLGAHRPQHADRLAAGDRHHAHGRSVGRLVLRRAPDL